MIKIEAFIRPSSLPAFHKALTAAGVKGISAWESRGVGHEYNETAKKEVFRGAELKREYIQRLRLETVIDDADKTAVLAALTEVAEGGDFGTVKVFVTPVLEELRIPKD